MFQNDTFYNTVETCFLPEEVSREQQKKVQNNNPFASDNFFDNMNDNFLYNNNTQGYSDYNNNTQSPNEDNDYDSGERGEAGGGELTDNGISTQETAYGITALGVSISGKTELFRVLEGSKNLPKYFKWSSKLGMRLGVVGLTVTALDGFTNPNGWQNHHSADMTIQGGILLTAAFFPGIGWVVGVGYFGGDLIFQHYHDGQGITEYYFDKP